MELQLAAKEDKELAEEYPKELAVLEAVPEFLRHNVMQFQGDADVFYSISLSNFKYR